MYRNRAVISAIVIVAGLLVPAAAHAYIGPGAGFALISSFLTLVIAFFTAFLALLTFPFRAIVRHSRRRRSLKRSKASKVIVLGLDGLEPTICERMMEDGELPNMKKLMDTGSYRRLATSTPALSPVAWSTFATGVDSSRHAIYDFLTRDRRTYLPKLSSSEVHGAQKFIRLGPVTVPIGKGGVRMLRKSKTFWKVLSDHGVFCSVLRVPITFPVEKINGVMIAGMCVPDLRGSMGSFTYFTSSEVDDKIGGKIVRTENGSDGWMTAVIPGPASPLDGKLLELPLSFRVREAGDGGASSLDVKVSGQTVVVSERTYSPWIRLTFKAAPGIKLNGIVRFYPTRIADDVGLYMTPIHIDPEKPAMPLSHPSFYSIYLAKLLGPYGTLGLAEDTWALNERVLDEKGFLDQAYLLHDERKKMWFHTLDRLSGGLACIVFDLSDRLQHMFFRYLDDTHPANRGKDTSEYSNAVYQMYHEMDDLVGKTMEYVDDDTALFVMSDHGFKQFKRGVNVNTWLRDEGLLTTNEGAAGGEFLSTVDWTKTRAYSIGLDGIYINLKGRERDGTVGADEFEAVKKTIVDGLAALRDENGSPAVNHVYDVKNDFTGPYRNEGPDLIVGFSEGYRVSWDCAKGTIVDHVFEDNTKSWSGDHCIDPVLVPGILYSNLQLGEKDPRLMDLGPTVLDLFGVDVPGYMVGKSIL
jgi:predicted AlkP superfamily phosphohydrolase/phosphomutase